MTTEISVYDLLGGDRQSMRAVTSSFYRRVLADDMLAPYFASVDMDKQSVMLAEFLALAFGGPHAYAGRDLRTAHAQIPGLTDAHFDQVIAHLSSALREHGVAQGDVATVCAVAETVRDDVLNR
ncbi:MAG TPA: group 1 truncated hemoglobin [Streptosporangiaceae bacterium]|jgi:hemoglobin